MRQGRRVGLVGGALIKRRSSFSPPYSQTLLTVRQGPERLPRITGNGGGQLERSHITASLHRGKRDQGSTRLGQLLGEGHGPPEGKKIVRFHLL